MNTRHMLLAVSIAAFTAGCGDDDPLNLNGALSFSHSGSVSGTFNASGRVPLFGEFGSTAWAAGGRDVQNGAVVAMAILPAPSQRYHMALITIERLTPGSASIGSSCTSGCAFIAVEFGTSESDSDFSFNCFITSGTAAIASISDNRVSGTFSGTGTCTDPSNVTTSFAISNGSFDVPLLPEGSLP